MRETACTAEVVSYWCIRPHRQAPAMGRRTRTKERFSKIAGARCADGGQLEFIGVLGLTAVDVSENTIAAMLEATRPLLLRALAAHPIFHSTARNSRRPNT